MIKFGFPILFGLCVIILGLVSPANESDPLRDPVPSSQKVAHSVHCSGCHGKDETGQALVDDEGNDVSIFDDWQFSMMGLSAHDPFWRATLNHETNLYPDSKNGIEATCLKCHAPLGSFHAAYRGIHYSFEAMMADSLGLDGVSCSACHQQPSAGLGSNHNGHIIIDTNRVLFGQYPNPFKGPMQIYVDFEPVFSDHIYSSGVCAGCHTLITETLDENGMATGHHFIEQSTYHEWLNSVYPAQGKECQTCHMPFIADSVVIATDFLSLNKRYPFGLHQFFGANTAMLSMMRDHREDLGIAPGSEDEVWNESINNNRYSLSQACNIELAGYEIVGDTMHLDLVIRNKTGHKLPSGYPSRIAWMQVIMSDENSGDTIYANGLMNAEGEIAGRDFPFETHHQVSSSAEDVQIYEMVMADEHGQLTTRLNAAAEPLKDNRLLPRGFRRNHQVYDTTAIWGTALDDPDYNALSQAGEDRITYKIPLGHHQGIARVDVYLRYHTFPSRWMQDLFQSDSLFFVGQFKSMYAGYETHSELIDHLDINNILLDNTSVVNPFSGNNMIISPNPIHGNEMQIHFPEHAECNGCKYQIMDINGIPIQTGNLTSDIKFSKRLMPGLYYLVITDKNVRLAARPFVVS